MKIKKLFLNMITLSSLLVLGSGYSVSATENIETNTNLENTPLQGTLGLSENGGYNPNPPSNLNQKTEIGDSYFGISYVPRTFDFGAVKLNDDIHSQTIQALKKNNIDTRQGDEKLTFNVGIKDKRRETTNEWTLFAKLENQIGEADEGLKLKIPISDDNPVKRNINNGQNAFQPNDLTDQLRKNGSNEVISQKNLTITKADIPVMYTQKDAFVNGVYDLELSDVTLNIPDASKVAAQTLNTNVKWTLSNTPTDNEQLIESVKNLFSNEEYTNLKESVSSKELAEVEKQIYQLNGSQEKYNLQHFNKYAKGHLMHWDLKDSSRKHLASLKIITNFDNTRAGLFFDNFFEIADSPEEPYTFFD